MGVRFLLSGGADLRQLLPQRLQLGVEFVPFFLLL